MSFPFRDLTSQYISSSYQNVLQKYVPGTGVNYILDGTGDVYLYISASTPGSELLTSNSTASYTNQSLSASYAENASTSDAAAYAILALTADTASYADDAISSSWASLSISSSWSENSISASYAQSASYEILYEESSSFSETASYWDSSILSSSLGVEIDKKQTKIITGSLIPITSSFARSASWAPPGLATGSTYPITSSWATNTLTASFSKTSSTVIDPNVIFNQDTEIRLGNLSTYIPYTIIVSGTDIDGYGVIFGRYTDGSQTNQVYSAPSMPMLNYIQRFAGTGYVFYVNGIEKYWTNFVFSPTASWYYYPGSTPSPHIVTSRGDNGSSFTGSFLGTSSYSANVASASWANNSVSASYARSASYWNSSSLSSSLGLEINNKQTQIVTGSLIPITSSWAENILTASYLHGTGKILGGIQFDTASTIEVNQEGYIFWDTENHTLALKSDKTGSTLQIGQEQWIRILAHEYIPNGKAVYVSHAEGGIPCGELGLANGEGIKDKIVGIATEDIPSGSVGLVTSLGQVHDLNTSLWPEGSSLYLSPFLSGSLQITPPEDPYETVAVGYVLVSDATTGIIQVNISNIGAKDYPFVGVVRVPSITTGSGVVHIGTGSINLCTTTDGRGLVKNFTINSASFALDMTFLNSQYVIANYNSGSPQYELITDRSSVDSIQKTHVYTVTPGAGGIISYVDYNEPGTLLANKLLTRIGYTRGIERASGLGLSESGSRYIETAGGVVWMGSKQISLSAFNSSTGRLVQIHHTGSNAWSSSLITQFNNQQYDNGTGLATLPGGDWVVNWVYRGVGQLNTSIIQLSNRFGNKTLAIESQPPTPPPELSSIAILIGRAIVQKNASHAAQIDSAFIENFTPAGITNHADLSNLQGGTSGEHYHLTATEYAQLGETPPVAYRTFPSSSNVLVTDGVIYVSASSAPIIVTMPDVVTVAGQFFRIKKIDSTGYEVIISSSVNIDCDTELRLSQRGSSVTLHSDATQYWIH